jgi:hypothetical protein
MSRIATGVYDVVFNQDVSQFALEATCVRVATTISASVAPTLAGQPIDQVDVGTADLNGSPTDSGFFLALFG